MPRREAPATALTMDIKRLGVELLAILMVILVLAFAAMG